MIIAIVANVHMQVWLLANAAVRSRRPPLLRVRDEFVTSDKQS